MKIISNFCVNITIFDDDGERKKETLEIKESRLEQKNRCILEIEVSIDQKCEFLKVIDFSHNKIEK
jgi:hypothetical protein